ncbi:plasma kallikrein-like, partial [Saccoglossus kowalevskii]
MCSLLSPECGVNGTYRQPCRAFCDDVRSACEDTMHFGGLVWPVNCSSLPSPVEAVDCIRITPCLSFPCQHNGTCLATSEQNYTCACEAGYIGHQCEIDFDECSSTPCANGGTCIDGINDYTCFCSIGYTGQQCDCVDITIESCQYLDLNYARLASFSRSRSNNQGIRDFIQSLQYERAGCYEHIGFFMCALLAPECSDEGYYRPPCNYFCEIARSECEPKFNTGGIRWPIDCDVLPNNNDSAVCVPDPNVAAGSGLCGRRLFGSDRIVGGMAAQLGSWPWQVSVLRHGSHICGAVIIDPNWILTAAHCVDGYSASSYELRMGFISQADSVPTEIRRSVNEIIMHPVYEYPPWYNDYDVALFRVEPAIEYTEYIRPACLPPANDLSFFHAGELCTVSGWGFLYDGGYVANSLQEAEINLWDQATCNSMLNSNILDSYICAGGPGAGSASTCS